MIDAVLLRDTVRLRVLGDSERLRERLLLFDFVFKGVTLRVRERLIEGLTDRLGNTVDVRLLTLENEGLAEPVCETLDVEVTDALPEYVLPPTARRLAAIVRILNIYIFGRSYLKVFSNKDTNAYS